MNHLSVQTVDQCSVFRLRITDDDIVRRDKEHIADLAFCGEGLAAARCAKNKSVGVFQVLAIYHDKIVGKCV